MVIGGPYVMTTGIFQVLRWFVLQLDSHGLLKLPGMQHSVEKLIEFSWMMPIFGHDEDAGAACLHAVDVIQMKCHT